MRRRKYTFVTNEINKEILEEINAKLGGILLLLTKIYGEEKWSTTIARRAEKKPPEAIAPKNMRYAEDAREWWKMDERKMKKYLEFYMIERMQVNLANAFGERPQELFLHEIGIENPTNATKARLTRLIDKLYRIKRANIRR